jgi:hypothetical protein
VNVVPVIVVDPRSTRPNSGDVPAVPVSFHTAAYLNVALRFDHVALDANRRLSFEALS